MVSTDDKYVTNDFNNWQNCSTLSLLKLTKHQIHFNKIHIYQQCTKLINSWSKYFNNVVGNWNIIFYRLLLILVTIVHSMAFSMFVWRTDYAMEAMQLLVIFGRLLTTTNPFVKFQYTDLLILSEEIKSSILYLIHSRNLLKKHADNCEYKFTN